MIIVGKLVSVLGRQYQYFFQDLKSKGSIQGWLNRIIKEDLVQVKNEK